MNYSTKVQKLHVLVIDDEVDLLELVRYNMSSEGYVVSIALTGEEGLKIARETTPDVLVLDLMLPGLDGLDICRLLKSDKKTADIPILMLTARGEEGDIVAGLELGADDYMTKPFSIRVLIARVGALIRRNQGSMPGEQDVLELGLLSIHPGMRRVTLEGNEIELTYTEFNVLHLLALHPGWVFTRNQIIEASRGQNSPVTDRVVDTQIVGLRRKLGNYGNLIEAVRGVGYRFSLNE